MGYDINSIRNRLISSGYDLGAIDGAVNHIYHPSTEAAPKAWADFKKALKAVNLELMGPWGPFGVPEGMASADADVAADPVPGEPA